MNNCRDLKVAITLRVIIANKNWTVIDSPILSYLIVPGAYVNDVSRAVPGGDRGGQRVLDLAPQPAQGTPFDTG